MRRVLIGSNGGLTGIYLAKNLGELDDVLLFGADTGDVNCGRYFVKQQFVLPNADDAGFIEGLVRLLDENNINYYLPTHSHEIAVISRYEKVIREHSDTKFIVSPYETYMALEEKDAYGKNLSDLGVPVPKLIRGYHHPYPVFKKKKKGSGGLGSCMIGTEELQRAYEQENNENVFFEYIDGTEYTCDCLFNFNGALIGSYERKRVKTIGGAVSVSESSGNNFGLPYIQKIADRWKMCGCVNFQYIVRDNIPYFTDINLRYPSGGLPLTVAAGIDIPKLVLKLLDGDEVASVKAGKKQLRMYRYFEEIIEEMP